MLAAIEATWGDPASNALPAALALAVQADLDHHRPNSPALVMRKAPPGLSSWMHDGLPERTAFLRARGRGIYRPRNPRGVIDSNGLN
jgi:hypothetical protein